MRDDQRITDFNGTPIAVGSSVTYGDTGVTVEVIEISDFDVDFNDATMRAECYPPQITVRFKDGVEDRLSTSENLTLRWSAYPDGPAVLTFTSDDLEVLPPGSTLPNGTTRERAEKLLYGYDSRMHGGYRNQQIAARDSLAHACGMGVRDLRRWLHDNPVPS